MGALALALLAGTAMGQQQDQDSKYKSDQSYQSQQNQGTFVPALRSADLTIVQKDTEQGKTCTCVFDHGQLVSCQIDGQDVSLDRVQVKSDKVCIMDENKSQKVAEIKIPDNVQRFTSGSGSSGYRGYNEQRFGSNEGRYQTQQNYQGQYQQDQYSRSSSGQGNSGGQDLRYQQESRNYNTGQDSRYPQDQGYARGSYSQDTSTNWRSQPYGQQQGQSEWQMRNETYSRNYNQPSSREDRFYTERQYQPRDQYSSTYSERYYPSEQRDRYSYNERSYQQGQPERYTYESRNYNPQPYSTDRSYQDRSYSTQRSYSMPQDQGGYEQRTWGTTEGTYSSSRPTLGVMMSEADRSDLQRANVDTGRFSQGILIEQVNPGSPAESAGLQRGDIIVAIDGSQPATTEMIRETLARKDFNDTVRLKAIHNGQERSYNVRLLRAQSTGYGRTYNTTGGDTQWNHRMPQQVPPEPNAEFQPGNSNWRPNMERSHYWYQDDTNNYGPNPR